MTASRTFMGKGCARAHVQMHSTNECGRHLANDPPTHIPNLNIIGRAVSEIQKRGVGVSLRARASPVTTA